MGLSGIHRRKVLWIGALLVASLVTGCAGIEPYEPRNHREEGPEKGLLTGSEGEFIIYRKADEPKEGIEGNESSDETADGEQQNIGRKEKNREIKSGKQQP